VIYLALVSILSIPIMMATVSVSRMNREGRVLTTLLERNRVALARVREDLSVAIGTSVGITNSGRSLAFSLTSGFDGTGPVTGDLIRYEILSDPTDPANGGDDNGNGVVDEGILVRTNATTGESVTLVTSLDREASAFVVFGDGVQVTISSVGKTHQSQYKNRLTKNIVVYPTN
jgi:hypothetical protein